MFTFLRTDSTNTDFINLVKELNAYFAVIDGEDHAFYNQFNKIENLKNVIVAYENDKAVGCGAIRAFSTGAMEVKRMYVLPVCRGKGIASKILAELEICAKELGHNTCILETHKKQADAVALYSKAGYKVIPNYGQYANMETSVCFEKTLS
jgi:putative acetyltransferase